MLYHYVAPFKIDSLHEFALNNGRFMPVVPNFRYFGVVFDDKLLLGGTRALHPAEMFQDN
jgi:hypothetical protein